MYAANAVQLVLHAAWVLNYIWKQLQQYVSFPAQKKPSSQKHHNLQGFLWKYSKHFFCDKFNVMLRDLFYIVQDKHVLQESCFYRNWNIFCFMRCITRNILILIEQINHNHFFISMAPVPKA